jgi:hypothetical protein
VLRRYTTVFVAMATPLADILLVEINGGKLVWEFWSRRSEIREEMLSPVKNRGLAIYKLMAETWSRKLCYAC